MAYSKVPDSYFKNLNKKSMAKKMDPVLIAAKERHEAEVKYISSRYKIPMKILRAVMYETGKNGKPCRSRRLIYAALRATPYNYNIPLRKK